MFTPKTKKIRELNHKFPKAIKALEQCFNLKTNVYIDYANIFHWQDKLGWHFDFKRLYQLLKSFDHVNSIKFYQGTIIGDEKSENFIQNITKIGYTMRTKPVKIMYPSIDVTGIPNDSPEILKNFINKSLINKLDIETIKYLNNKLLELNRQGIKSIKHLKCNFDVEIASDMRIDLIKDTLINNFILWSGDSDFEDTVNNLINLGKKVAIFTTARRLSRELSQTKA